MKKDIILLGIQGSGKGTQAGLLIQKLDSYMYYEMGETLRAFHSNNNLIGDYMKELMNKGEMIDNFITHHLISIVLGIVHKEGKHVMIDGFPRMMEQAEFFINKEKELNRDFLIIQYVLTKEVALERMMARAAKEGRKDDTPKVMKRRIELFEINTMPVLKKFEKMGKLLQIDADGQIDDIFQDTCKKLSL